MDSVILSANFAHRRTIKAAHYHDSHEIIFVSRGSALIEVNHSRYTVSRGNLVIFSRFEQHAVTSRSDDYERYVLQIAPHVPIRDQDGYKIFSILFNRPERFENVLDFSAEADKMEKVFQRIVEEKIQSEPLKENMLNLLMQELLIFIRRRYPAEFENANQDNLEIIRQIQARFEANYAGEFTLSQLAQEFGISACYLSHRFKAVTGNSVMGYLMSCRIAAAKKYLTQTNLEISTIVENCGFSDDSNFSRTFKKLTDFTPSQFRKKFRDDYPAV